jgi:hypothetical protein
MASCEHQDKTHIENDEKFEVNMAVLLKIKYCGILKLYRLVATFRTYTVLSSSASSSEGLL